MSFELQSTRINSAETELIYLNSQGVGDASSAFQAFLGGAMVEELDSQIQVFTAELVALSEEKAAVRADKLALTELEAGAEGITEDLGFATVGPDGTPVPYIGKGKIMSSGDTETFIKEAASLGVTIDITKTPSRNGGTEYVIDESYFDSMKQALDDKLTDLNSTSEMKSIQFQALMDSRKQAMMMLSNLMNSDNQTKMAIIQNMKG